MYSLFNPSYLYMYSLFNPSYLCVCICLIVRSLFSPHCPYVCLCDFWPTSGSHREAVVFVEFLRLPSHSLTPAPDSRTSFSLAPLVVLSFLSRIASPCQLS